MNQHHLEFIYTEFQLGTPIGDVKAVHGSRGGSLMWRVQTEKGSYAIKQLAPVIDIKNEKTVARYELSEDVAYRFAQNGIKVVSAIKKAGRHLIVIDDIGYLVFPWVEGYALGRNEVSDKHAIKIAEILAKIHNIDMNVPEITEPRIDAYSNDSILQAIDRAESLKCPCSQALKDNKDLLLSVNDSYHAVIPLLKEQVVVTHGDLNQLNVLWDNEDQPILIDWEAVKKMNPTREIVRASLAWGGIGTDDFSFPIYSHMLHKYIESGGNLNVNHVEAALYAGFGNGIHWMLYNIEMACSVSDFNEKEIAKSEISSAMAAMNRFAILLPDILKISPS